MRFALRNLVIAVLLSVASSAQFIDINTQTKGSRLPSWGVDSGSANAYAITTIQAIGSGGVLQTGSSFAFIATHANTGASTLAVDGGSTISITKFGATALASGDIPSSGAVTVIYDGTNFQMQGVLPTSGGGGSGSGCSTGLPGSVCAYYPNSSTGTTLNHTVRFLTNTINQSQITDFTNTDAPGWASGLIGIVQSGQGTSGLAEVCTAGRCLCDFDTAATKGDFVDLAINASSAPKCHDVVGAGLNEDPQAHTFFGKVHTTIGSPGVTDVDMLTVMAFTNGGYSNFGAGDVALIGGGGQHLNISPMGIETSGGAATNTEPYMSTFTGHRIRVAANTTYYFDFFGNTINDTSGSPMIFGAQVDTSGFAGGSRVFRISCEACSGPNKASSHYTPPYTASVGGGIVLDDISADVRNLTLTSNTTVTFNFVLPGHIIWWNICQDATGGRTFSLSGVSGGGFVNAPTISTTANVCTTFSSITLGTEATPSLYVISGGSGGGGISTPVSIANGGTGTGSTLTGIVRGNASAMTAAELSGDCTTSGSNAVTCSKLNGGSMPASAGVLGSNSSSQPVAASAHGIAGTLTCADASGSGTTQTCTTTPSFTPAAKDCVWYTPGTSNSGALTLNVNSAGAKAVQKWLGTALASGDAPSGKTQLACYDGTNWQVMTIGNAPSGGSGYATVQNNGSSVTQRATINFISGVNITSSCVDNSGASRTDCTISGVTTVTGVPINGNNGESGSAAGLTTLISPFAHAGDMFLTFCPFWSGAVGTITVTDSQSLTWTATGNTGLNTSDFQSQMWVANATALGLGDNITCNVGGGGGSGHQAIAALEITGSVVVDQSAFGNVNSAVTGVTLSFTTTGTDTLLVMAFDADRSSVDSFTGLSGYTKVLFGNGSSGIYYALYYKTGVASGSQSITVTGASTHPLHVAFVAVK